MPPRQNRGGKGRHIATPHQAASNQPPVRVEQPISAEVISSEDSFGSGLNSLVPCCGLGCIVLFVNNHCPSCVGCRLAGDIFCCALELNYCRILGEDSHPGKCITLVMYPYCYYAKYI